MSYGTECSRGNRARGRGRPPMQPHPKPRTVVNIPAFRGDMAVWVSCVFAFEGTELPGERAFRQRTVLERRRLQNTRLCYIPKIVTELVGSSVYHPTQRRVGNLCVCESVLGIGACDYLS